MELRQLVVQGYRRFEEETNLHLDGKLVALLGPNEAGKTSLIKAINHFSNTGKISKSDCTYNTKNDTWIELKFRLSDEECKLCKVSKSSILEIFKDTEPEIGYIISPKPTRNLDVRRKTLGIYNKKIDILKNNSLKEFFTDVKIANIEQIFLSDEKYDDTEIENLNKFLADVKSYEEKNENEEISKDFSELIKVIQNLIEFEESHDPEQFAVDILKKLIPQIHEFGPEFRNIEIPFNIVGLSETEEGDEDNTKTQLLRPKGPLLKLVDIAQLDLDVLFEASEENNTALIKDLIDDANTILKTECNKVWGQSDTHLVFDFNKPELTVLVKNEKGFFDTRKHNNIVDRSDGYRQFIALRIFSFLSDDYENSILLIDEMEQHLHYDAQADLVQMLTSDKSIGKVIYSTHSVGCLPEDLGNGIRLVNWDKKNKKKSRVINKFWGEDLTSGFAPMLLGMGATTLAFFPTRNALVGEGPSELLLLPRLFREALQENHLGFQVVHGLSNLKIEGISAIDSVTNRACFFVDNDDAGETLKKHLEKAGISAERIFSVSETDQATTVEDLLEESVWVEAVNKYVDEFGSKDGLEHIGSPPTQGRIKAIDPKFEEAKVAIAYNVIALAEANPDRKLLCPGKFDETRQTAEKIKLASMKPS